VHAAQIRSACANVNNQGFIKTVNGIGNSKRFADNENLVNKISGDVNNRSFAVETCLCRHTDCRKNFVFLFFFRNCLTNDMPEKQTGCLQCFFILTHHALCQRPDQIQRQTVFQRVIPKQPGPVQTFAGNNVFGIPHAGNGGKPFACGSCY